MAMRHYPLAKQGVFRTIQGEGLLLGLPMIFVRLAGCSIGCPLCDTDYAVHERLTATEIAARCSALRVPGYPRMRDMIWITGGEPTDHDLVPLIHAMLDANFAIAVATAGHKPWPKEVDAAVAHFSVSPHDPSKWVVRRARGELKLIPGLNGFHLRDFIPDGGGKVELFGAKYVVPCDGLPETVEECREWVLTHPEWRMGVQAHKLWRLP